MNINRLLVEDRIWNVFQRSPYLVRTGVSAKFLQLLDCCEWSSCPVHGNSADRETDKISRRCIADIAEERGPGKMETEAVNQKAVKWAHWAQEGIVGSCTWHWGPHHETTEWWGQDWFYKLPAVQHSRLLWTECFVFFKIPVLKPNP